MGVAPLFLCFQNQQPNCMVFTGLGASILSFAFLIWGVADLEYKRKGVQAIYIISFILVILIMLAFIALFIFLNLRRTQAFRTIMSLGRIICLVIICMCAVAFIFMLVAFIILIVDYAKFHSFLNSDDPDENIDDYVWATDLSFNVDEEDGSLSIKPHEWAAIFVPSIITLICLVVMALVANILYKVFYENMNPTTTAVNVTDATIPTVPNVPQPGVFPNNNGPVPPVVNYAPYPVTIQQSGLAINK